MAKIHLVDVAVDLDTGLRDGDLQLRDQIAQLDLVGLVFVDDRKGVL